MVLFRRSLCIGLFFLSCNGLFADEVVKDERPFTTGTSFERLFYGIGRLCRGCTIANLNGGRNQINISFLYWYQNSWGSEEIDLFGLGISPSYRTYHSNVTSGKKIINEGFFSELVANFAVAIWFQENEVIPVYLLLPALNVGYKWNSEVGINLAPFIGISYGFSQTMASEGTKYTFNNAFIGKKQELGGFNPSLGITIEIMFDTLLKILVDGHTE